MRDKRKKERDAIEAEHDTKIICLLTTALKRLERSFLSNLNTWHEVCNKKFQ